MKETKPIIINDLETGEKYTLEFSRETAIFTDNQGFRVSEFDDKFNEMLPILFYGAFRMHHKRLSREKTDKILFEKLKGLSPEAAKRLIELYAATRESLINEKDEEDEKNALATVEL